MYYKNGYYPYYPSGECNAPEGYDGRLDHQFDFTSIPVALREAYANVRGNNTR